MSEARELFEKGFSPLRIKASQPLINHLEKAHLQSGKPLFDFLQERLHLLKADIERKQLIFIAFEIKHDQTFHLAARQAITLEFAKELGASPKELKKDKRAFSRWFDFNAVADRCRHQISSMEHELGFIIDRLGLLMVLEPSHPKTSLLLLLTDWAQHYRGNHRIKTKALESILKLLTPEVSLDSEVFYYLSLSDEKDVWIQCNSISILQYLNPSLFKEVAAKRLNTYHTGADFFVRQHITTLLSQGELSLDSLFVASILNDPSDFVRQALCQKISFLPQVVVETLLKDSSPQVRALAILNVISQSSFEARCAQLADMCSSESHPFVLRVCLKCIKDGFQNLSVDEGKEWLRIFEPILDHLHSSSPDIPTRRRAAQTREEFWCEKNPSLREAKMKITSFLINIKPGTGAFIPFSFLDGLKEEEVGRLFSLVTQLDFGCELKKAKKGYRIFRGLRIKFRLWRFLYEFLHPKPEKREACRHTVGRHFQGEIQAPSSILAEQSQTQVPGEPLYLPEEGGYRPYLPLVDHMLSIVQKKRSFLFYTSEGITTVKPPEGVWKRLRAKSHLTFHFSSFAERRNWRMDSSWEPSQYVKSLQALGFKFQFQPYDDRAEKDSAVTRFFPAFAFFQDWEPFISYVLASKVSILGLSFCLIIVSLHFFWQHIRNYRALKITRRSLPLVVGGWGTRGKSSTERLKGALINELGFSIFSKTTGCEAMVAFAGSYQKMHEIPYYRPYEKVTILEQVKATFLASKFKSDVMLWECMALRPDYVKIIQQQWMRNDLSTLTNAFPDHEDFQGPAGYNIAETLASFILQQRPLLTAEEQMLPYFQADAREKEAKLETVGWLEQGLLTNDVLDRFPYLEHPQNIALVLKMAEHFNVPPAVALKEIADNVLPDIGALKVYPTVSLNFRSLQFINGMSANEEYACLSNWYRVGLDQLSPPGVWICALINNREDRIARSRVFAQLLINNINADKYFVVGSNINGFMGFAKTAWLEFINTLPLSHNPQAHLEKLAHKLRICFTTEDLEQRLVAMGAVGFKGDFFNLEALRNFLEQQEHPAIDGLLHFHQENIKMLEEYNSLYDKLDKKTDEKDFKNTLTKWFMSKFILPKRNDLSGDEMISWVCEHTPPHYLNKIMGIQNIKGPGLEFVHRWQEWEKCYHAGELLLNPLPHKVLQGFRDLRELPEFGILTQEYLKKLFVLLSPQHDIELDHLKSHIEETKKGPKFNIKEKQNILMKWIYEFFDIEFSLIRRKKVNQIYEDLVSNRISFSLAREELIKFTEMDSKK